MEKGNKLVIYKDKQGEFQLKVKIGEETVWLSLLQMAQLFHRDKSVISRHLKNIFSEKELERNSVVAFFATTAADGKKYQVEYYNLDVIISIGYRVNSTQGTQFRIWANKILKQYLLHGYVVNEKKLLESQKKLKELQATIKFIDQCVKSPELIGQEQELLTVISDYSNSLTLLDRFDKKKIRGKGKGEPTYILNNNLVKEVIDKLKKNLLDKKEASLIFGNEVDNKFAAIMGNIYQTFDGIDLYVSIEDKAAHLLYFTIKDHPFLDGNKRIGSIMFVYYLNKNRYLFRDNGERKINDNTLVALALLVAVSNPHDKDIIIKLIINLIKP